MSLHRRVPAITNEAQSLVVCIGCGELYAQDHNMFNRCAWCGETCYSRLDVTAARVLSETILTERQKRIS